MAVQYLHQMFLSTIGREQPMPGGNVADMSQVAPIVPLTYTVQEFAQLFAVTPRHVHRMIERQEVPAIRFGRRWVIPRAAVRRILDGAMPGLGDEAST
jgi:excisionase family DNA binding protein